jgi:penicillin amidase
MKKRFRILLKILLGLLTILIISLYAVTNHLKPTYSGTIDLSKLSTESIVKFDDFGIPHIYAENEEDALRSLGYVHAQDRLWQMELMRRIAPGQLSEIFGEIALENDILFAGLGIEEASEKAIKLMDKNGAPYKLSTAYLDGVNQFIENGQTPIEYRLLKLKKRKFTLKDSYNIIGYMAFSFAMAHKTDPVLSSIQSKFGDQYIAELGIKIPKNSTFIQNYNDTNEKITTAIHRVFKNSPIPSFIGSNSWIASGKKTKSGKVLFANDPHIEFSSPSVWYEAHIKTPNFESYGYYLGGIPFPIMSHNRKYAYGLTMFENDDIDFYQEKKHLTDSSKYRYKNRYKNYESAKKIIKVKNGKEYPFEVKSTLHGPIMNNFIIGIDSQEPIAISWIYTKIPNQLMTALYEMSRATDKLAFQIGVSKIHAPGLNIMYGDKDGNISWWAAAQLYKLENNANSKLILNGSQGEQEIERYLSFNENPQAHNPPRNYVYSANNQPDSIAEMLYPGYYLPEDRAKRIVALLEPKNDWTKEDFMKMINDVKSPITPSLIQFISNEIHESLTTPNEKEALNLIEKWDGTYIKSSVSATIYTKFVYAFLTNTFEDEIGKETFKNFINTHLMKRMIAKQIRKNNSAWWDNIHTTEKENKTDIIRKSFTQAISALEKQLGPNINTWTWDRVHTIEHPHPLGSVKLLDYIFTFNIGPFEVDGSNEVLNNQMFDLTSDGIYRVKGGPSTRRIIDFSDIENSVSILPTGNSGNPFSPFYKDQAAMYAQGKFRKMKLNKQEIDQVSTTLILKPRK